MWYPAATIEAPDAEPITLDQVKDLCEIDFEDKDDLLNRQIAVARDHTESYCGIRIATQTVAASCDSFTDFARLEVVPVQSISSISYVDTDGASQVLSTSVYELRADGIEAAIVRAFNQSWPAIQQGSRITVTAIVGYEDDAVPPAIINAMLVFVASLFDTRENVKAEAWTSFDVMLCNHRRGV